MILYRSDIINADFPFRYPIKLDTLIFGGMLTNIWMWPGIRCPSIISTPLYERKGDFCVEPVVSPAKQGHVERLRYRSPCQRGAWTVPYRNDTGSGCLKSQCQGGIAWKRCHTDGSCIPGAGSSRWWSAQRWLPPRRIWSCRHRYRTGAAGGSSGSVSDKGSLAGTSLKRKVPPGCAW